VTKLWTSGENDGRESCSAGNLLGERVSLQEVAGIVVLYVEPPSAKGVGESLLREYLLIELLGERLTRQVVPMRVSAGLGERVARQVVARRYRTAECQSSRRVTSESET
jgi:hypothetical protein